MRGHVEGGDRGQLIEVLAVFAYDDEVVVPWPLQCVSSSREAL
ncbi:hypothetical protein [Arthrobacter sp. STN4]|nr:hypothetical protein [Arthrobacter sp. STN4]